MHTSKLCTLSIPEAMVSFSFETFPSCITGAVYTDRFNMTEDMQPHSGNDSNLRMLRLGATLTCCCTTGPQAEAHPNPSEEVPSE